MQWQDAGLVLGLRPHGETSVVLELLTEAHGRHLGLLRGARGRRGLLQPGNTVRAQWRGRLSEHLGTFQVEPLISRVAPLIEEGLALGALRAACALAQMTLPERDPHPDVFAALSVLFDRLAEPAVWPALFVRFELGLLEALGFGLDLTRCAVTGSEEDLVFVSPNTGRAVSREGAGTYAPRLLRLPAFLRGGETGGATLGDVADGLALTGHFLDRRLLAPHGRPLPAARIHLVERLRSLADPMA